MIFSLFVCFGKDCLFIFFSIFFFLFLVSTFRKYINGALTYIRGVWVLRIPRSPRWALVLESFLFSVTSVGYGRAENVILLAPGPPGGIWIDQRPLTGPMQARRVFTCMCSWALRIVFSALCHDREGGCQGAWLDIQSKRGRWDRIPRGRRWRERGAPPLRRLRLLDPAQHPHPGPVLCSWVHTWRSVVTSLQYGSPTPFGNHSLSCWRSEVAPWPCPVPAFCRVHPLTAT